ncbi:hypothetical protein Acr_11g0007480 [Actinidia rufa]|uniref:Uncharacterized protein n=1 Tax=Actinidia rufa TaxID=165716 RepID=A0A7J0FCM7_9ERIC|nr:hypothetical protein Acr_11g0007480 [Actinidia rufa]
MRQNTRSYQQPQLFWPKVVVRKWLNLSAKEFDYSADTDSDCSDSDSDPEDQTEDLSLFIPQKQFWKRRRELQFRHGNKGDEVDNDLTGKV